MTTKDLAIFYVRDGVIVPGFTARPLPLTGFDKLFNNVLKFWLTDRGSDPFDKSYGSSLVAMLGTTGNDEDFVSESIEESLDQVRTYFKNKAAAAAIAGTSYPDSEILGEILLLSFELQVDTLRIYVSISNKLGVTKMASISI